MQSPSTDVTGLKVGDKFTVEYEVDGEGFVRSNTWCSSVTLARSLQYSQPYFKAVNITSVTKAPRVPKAGDRWVRGGTGPFTIIFIDDKSVIHEQDGSNRRTYHPRADWDRNGPEERVWL